MGATVQTVHWVTEYHKLNRYQAASTRRHHGGLMHEAI
jgi:hypothetical protein